MIYKSLDFFCIKFGEWIPIMEEMHVGLVAGDMYRGKNV